jgi:hypothetical protein
VPLGARGAAGLALTTKLFAEGNVAVVVGTCRR